MRLSTLTIAGTEDGTITWAVECIKLLSGQHVGQRGYSNQSTLSSTVDLVRLCCERSMPCQRSIAEIFMMTKQSKAKRRGRARMVAVSAEESALS